MLMRRLHQTEDGFTLIELLVVTVIGTVIGGIVMSAIVQSLRTTATVQDRVATLAELEKGMERITRELRAANPLQLDISGDYANAVTSTVTRGGARIAFRYEIEVDADGVSNLIQKTFTYDLNGVLQPGVTNSLITELENAPDQPLFTYLDAVGEGVVCPPAPASCITDLLQAEQVRLTLARNIPDADPLVLTSTVRIRSLRYTSDPTNLGIIVGEIQP